MICQPGLPATNHKALKIIILWISLFLKTKTGSSDRHIDKIRAFIF
jgi:hypothetical protein